MERYLFRIHQLVCSITQLFLWHFRQFALPYYHFGHDEAGKTVELLEEIMLEERGLAKEMIIDRVKT